MARINITFDEGGDLNYISSSNIHINDEEGHISGYSVRERTQSQGLNFYVTLPHPSKVYRIQADGVTQGDPGHQAGDPAYIYATLLDVEWK